MNSLGFDKDPKDTRVVVAMSGGVDSSVVAALLHEQGYDVVGVTLQLYDMGDSPSQTVKSKTCCAGQDIYDAKRVAETRGFPHYVLNYESNFKESVIEEFADSYIKGETPIPCVRCNQTVKFRDLLKVAHDLGADCMATGHYIQRSVNDNGQAELIRAHDHLKDQSYFLFATTQEQLDFLRFPIGSWSKEKTRQEATRLGLITADKPDSQDICFVPNGDYTKIVKKLRPEAENPGDIVDEQGNMLGQHKGIIHYTIGQRRGIGIGGGMNKDNSPFFVIRIDAKNNQVIVGPKESLARNVIHIEDCNWLKDVPEQGIEIDLKFRSVMKPIPAKLKRNGSNLTGIIELKTPQYGISPGQAAVCYTNDRVIGGGWIKSTAKK
ncbi:tRNA 2-thiouridine(34) synthase MnmA [Alphaproteobacteria bacterium]|nr:tRNA 2-thiouridine(34) synthase MnmA [Alphaproteobacteria bacterium]